MSTNARRTERYAKQDQDFITQRECKQLVAYAINRYDEMKRAERLDRRLWARLKTMRRWFRRSVDEAAQ